MSEQPDVGGFGAIAQRHRAQLQRVAVRLCGNAELAKDLVQEALFRAMRRFDQFQQGTHAGTWLAAILTNLYLDYLKHQQVERKAEPELAQLELSDDDCPIAGIADDQLYAAVRALEPELREVVELCYLKEMRYREAAAALNVPTGTVGTRLMRARARLHELLTTTSPDAVKP